MIALEINSTNWYQNLRISEINEEIRKSVVEIENRYRWEDILSDANRLTIGSPFHGQLIDSQPSKDGHTGSRNAEIVIEATRTLKNKYCLRYNHSIMSMKNKIHTPIIIIICIN